MKIFKVKAFHRWAKSENITDKMLKKAVDEIADGLADGNLGAGLLKKRIARPGQGKRSGYRVLVGYREDARSIFFFGYAKNDLDNIEDEQLENLKIKSNVFLKITDGKIKQLVDNGDLIEVK